MDPTPDQWRGIFEVVQQKRLLPFFDSAYQVLTHARTFHGCPPPAPHASMHVSKLMAACMHADMLTHQHVHQGFASGDLDRDAIPLRMFADQGLEMLVSSSFAKNLGEDFSLQLEKRRWHPACAPCS